MKDNELTQLKKDAELKWRETREARDIERQNQSRAAPDRTRQKANRDRTGAQRGRNPRVGAGPFRFTGFLIHAVNIFTFR